MSVFDPVFLTAAGAPEARRMPATMRVEGGRALTPGQRAGVQRVFSEFATALRLSLNPGYGDQRYELEDGSRVRISAVAGVIEVFVTPAPPVINLQERPWGIYCVPADTTHQYGWVPPAVTGENGTTATDLTAGNGAAVRLNLKRDENDRAKLRSAGVSRFKDVYDVNVQNVAFFSSTIDTPNYQYGLSHTNMSLQNWEHREWVAPDYRAVVTTYTNQIRVNDVNVGAPSFVDLLWCCIYDYDPGTGTVPHLLLMCQDGYFLKMKRRELNGSVWTDVASLDLRDLGSITLVSGSAKHYVRKIDINASRTVVTAWIQQAPVGANPGIWADIADFDTDTGAITHTAPSEPTVTATNSSTLRTVAVSGVRQISFDYVGDEKVFTELHYDGEFSWERTENVVTAPIPWNPPVNYVVSADYTEEITDTRTVTLKRGDYEKQIAWVVIHSATFSDTFTSTGPPVNPSTNAPGTRTVDVDIYKTTHECQILHFGKGPIFLLRDMATLSSYQASGDVTLTGASTYSGSGIDITTGSVQVLATDTIAIDVPLDAVELPNGDCEISGDDTTTSHYAPGDAIPAITAQPTATSSDTAWMAGGFVTHHLGMTGYLNYPYAVDNYMNCRSVANFVLLSVPRLSGAADVSGRPELDPANFQTYCSDPSAFGRFNLDAATGVLKGIHLK